MSNYKSQLVHKAFCIYIKVVITTANNRDIYDNIKEVTNQADFTTPCLSF